jgi:hypothetical protein
MENYLQDDGKNLVSLLKKGGFTLFSLIEVQGKIYLDNFHPDRSQENLIGFPTSKLASFLRDFPAIDGLVIDIKG